MEGALADLGRWRLTPGQPDRYLSPILRLWTPATMAVDQAVAAHSQQIVALLAQIVQELSDYGLRCRVLSELRIRIVMIPAVSAPTIMQAALSVVDTDPLPVQLLVDLFRVHGTELDPTLVLSLAEMLLRNITAGSVYIPDLIQAVTDAGHIERMQAYLPLLMPLMMKILNTASPVQIRIQIQTLSLLVNWLRSPLHDAISSLHDMLVNVTRQLLVIAPASEHRSVLESVRTLVESSARSALYRQLDYFLDWDILHGRGSGQEFYLLAHDVFCVVVRSAATDSELKTMEQLARVVHTLCVHILDRSTSVPQQIKSLQVIFILVDNVFRVGSADVGEGPDSNRINEERRSRGRALLVRVLQTLVMKFESIASMSPGMIQTGQTAAIEEATSLLQILIHDLQTLLWRISNISAGPGTKASWMFKVDECRLVSKLLHWVVGCFPLFNVSNDQQPALESDTDSSSPFAESGITANVTNQSPVTARTSIFLEKFANVFVSLDQASFRRVIGLDIGVLFEALVQHPRLPQLVIPQQFLGNPSVSKIFADIVMLYLLERLNDMAAPTRADLKWFTEPSDDDRRRSATASLLLNLFRIVAGSLSLYADNEEALQPYMPRLIRRSMRQALIVQYKHHYLWMLRHMFRSIGGGKFQRLYQTFVPLLPELLSGLHRLQEQDCVDPSVRELAVELSLTVPARLSTLLTFIPLMMKSVVRALQSADEQVVKVGLRTFEFWVDKLNHDYLFDHLASDISSAMRALCALLKPAPAPFGSAALLLLGKLGGRNRRFLVEAMDLSYRSNVHEGLPLRVSPICGNRSSLSMTAIVESVVDRISSGTVLDAYALPFLQSLIGTLFDVSAEVTLPLEQLPKEKPRPAPTRSESEQVMSPDTAEQEMVIAFRRRPRFDAFDSAAHTLFSGLFTLASRDRAAAEYLERLSRFFALIDTDRKVFLTSLVDSLMTPEAFTSIPLTTTILNAISSFLYEMSLLYGVDGAVTSASVDVLLQKFLVVCQDRSIIMRSAGVSGISVLCAGLSPRWRQLKRPDIIDGLMATFSEEIVSFQQTRWFDAENEVDDFCPATSDVGLDAEDPPIQSQAALQVMQTAEDTLRLVIDATTLDSVSNGALTTRFAAFLTDPSWFARNVALRCLEHVATAQGVTTATILDAHLLALAEPVLQRTLAKVAPSMRVGHVWSAALALRLNPNLAPADQLATVVADAIENIKSGRAARTKGRDIVRLQVEYISLMSITVSCTSLCWNDDLRNAVVQSLFNAMVDRSSGTRVVNAAKRGLAMLCRHHKMPKTLLRNCLEPVLRNLAEPPTLSMPLLTLLEHLLQLLSHCFNVTLGRTLLDHLFFFSEALKQMLTVPQASVSLPAIRQPGDEIRLPCHLLDLFHRLPPAPRQFLTKLVMAVVSLESMLPLLRAFGGHGVGQPSPFRAPLMRFICKYAAESVAFFLTPKNLVDRRLSQLFLEILSLEDGAAVCDTLIVLSDQLLAASFNIEQSQQTQTNQMQSQKRSQQSMDSMQIDEGSEEAEPAVPRRTIPEKAVEELELQGVNIVYQLSQYSPQWLGQPDATRVVDALINSWTVQSNLQIDPETSFEKIIKRQRLAHCLINYWNAKLEETGLDSPLPTNILWMLLSAVDCPAAVDFSFLHRFMSQDVAADIHSSRLQQIARDFFTNVLPASSPFSDDERNAGLRSLIIPALNQRTERGVRVAALNLIMPRLFETCLDDRHSWQVRNLIIQLLCILLEKDPELVVRDKGKYIQQLIVFARAHCKQEPQIPISYNISALRLLVRASLLSKEVRLSAFLGLFVRCARAAAAHNSDCARNAMDALAEFFHEHWEEFPSDPLETPHENSQIFPSTDDDEFLRLQLHPAIPEWLAFLTAFAVRSPSGAMEVCSHVLRLQSMFSFYSHYLCDAIAESLSLLKSNATLVVEMTEQLVSWNVSASGSSSPKRQKTRRVSSRSSSPRIIKGSSWTASVSSVGSIVNALLQVYATYANHPPSVEAQLSRLLATIALVAREWPPASFAAVDKFAEGPLEAGALRMILLLLDTLLSARDLAFLQETPERLSVFDRVIRRVFDFPDAFSLLDPFLALLRRLESLVPVMDSSSELYSGLHGALQNGIQQKDVFVLHLALAALEIVSCRSPDYLAALNPSLSAAFHTLARRCLINRPSATKSNPATSGIVNDTVALLCAMRLISSRAQYLRDHRKQILSTIANLIEKCDDVVILREVVKMTCAWISSANGGLPDLSIKEKVGLLVRLSRLEEFIEERDILDCLNGAVLSLLERNEAANAMIRVELFRGLARPILGLLRSGSPSMFQRMISAIHTWAGSTLLSRLQFILESSGWATVQDRFWLAPGIELILSIILSSQPLQLCADSATLIEVGDLRPHQRSYGTLSTAQINSLMSHSEFVSDLVQFDPTPFITAMARIAMLDDVLAEMTFLHVFPLAWPGLDPVERSQLCSVASRLLPRDDLLKQVRCRPNAVGTLLGAFERAEQAIELRPELLSYLGRTYGVWHSARRLLERQIFSEIEGSLAIRALVELLNDLNERDVVAGVLQFRYPSGFTGAAMALEQYGLWPRAQEEFYNAMRSIHEPGSEAPIPTADESLLWEQEWLRSSRYLHQWSQLGDVFAHLSRPDLVIESASLSGDAVQLDKLLEPYSLDAHPLVPIKGLLYRLQVLLHQQAQLVLHLDDSKDGSGLSDDVVVDQGGAAVPQSVILQRITIKQNTTLDRTIDVALQEWSRRPLLIGNGHVELLARFQQLVEMRECRVMLEEAGKSWKASRIPDFKNGLASWRDRLPNPWDSIIIWNEIMTTRMHVFNRLSTAFRPLSANQSPDTPPHTDIINLVDPTWTIVKMAETARRQQLPQVCLTWLTPLLTVPSNSLSPADAFAKIREQVRVCMQSADEIRSAVSLLNLSSMERFTPGQCAELFRLKGEALEHLGLGEDSHTAFSSALAISDDYGKGWLSWGAFCDQLFGLQKDRQWAEYTISCYLQAVRFHTSDKARLMLARVLWLMSYDKNDGPLNSVFKKYAADLPVWVWLLWLPQLIASLPRHEGTAFTAILQNVARAFPQALYYGIRAYLHERRDLQRMQQTQAQANNNDPMSPNANAEQPAERSSANVRAVVTALRTQHLNLVAELEKMLEEFGRCFRPEPQEELLSTVQVLFVKCFRQPITHTDIVPESLTDNVRRVCSKFFMQSLQNCKPILKQFVEQYREKFLKDFLPPPDGSDYPLTLTRLMRRLKWWKSYLRYSVAQSHRDERSRQLIRLSPYLARFEARHIEVPGQYGHGHEPRPGSHIMLERFTPTVGIVRHNGMSFRRIGFIGSDGGTTYFLVQFFVAHITKSDERMMQMTRILNQLMLKSRETRERNMCFSVPSVIPLTNRLRLFESDPSVVSLDAVLEHMCFLKNMDADDALTVYRNQLGGVVDDQRDAARHNAHRRIMQVHVPPNTFHSYVEKSLSSFDAWWAFKMEFTKQLGLTSFLMFALKIGDRSPHKIWFSRKSGRIMQTDFYPSYSATHLIDHQESVPFRLTPNFTEFCTPFLIEGVFSTAFISSAACWLRRQHIVKNYLNLYLRDDLVSWSVTLSPAASDNALDELEKQLRPMVSTNTSQILARVQSLMPTTPSPTEANKLPLSINAKIQRLVESATSIDNLSAMPPTWHPWF